MPRKKIFYGLLLLLITLPIPALSSGPEVFSARLPVSELLGERLNYNVSFLWFKKIARGQISLEAGSRAGTYLATLKVRTRGMAAFFTRNRVETYQTLMEEGPDRLLRPLLQSTDTRKGKGSKVTHRQTSYTYDFAGGQAVYRKSINGVEKGRLVLPLTKGRPVYDVLTAFYNLRLGRLGPLDAKHDVRLAAFSRKGPEEIVIKRVYGKQHQKLNISDDLLLCEILLSPETFKTKSRDIFVAFDQQLRPLEAVIKNVIGLGDVRGELTSVVEATQRR